jgi:hypothetical protein
VTPAQWQMARRIPGILAGQVGLTDQMLAEHLNVTATELRPVVGMLISQRRIDSCWTGIESYLVLPAKPNSLERVA